MGMGTQAYRANYRAAFDIANDHLEQIYEEYRSLQLRKENLQQVVAALDPFLQSVRTPVQEIYAPEPIQLEPAPADYFVAEPIPVAVQAPQPIAPPAFAPAMEEVSMDPLQQRINRALGLAVA